MVILLSSIETKTDNHKKRVIIRKNVIVLINLVHSLTYSILLINQNNYWCITNILSSSSCLMICIRPISKHTAKHGQFGSTNPSLPSYLKTKIKSVAAGQIPARNVVQ